MKSYKFYFGAFVTFLAFCLFFFFFFGFKSARAETKKSMDTYPATTYHNGYGTAPDETKYTVEYNTDTATYTRYGQDMSYATTVEYQDEYVSYSETREGLYNEYVTAGYGTTEDTDVINAGTESGYALSTMKYEGDDSCGYDYTSAYMDTARYTREQMTS